jgi:hypothetical protein
MSSICNLDQHHANDVQEITKNGFVVCGRVYNNEGESGSIDTIYWNPETMTIAIGYYKYREADDEEEPLPESFTYYKWNHVPTYRQVIYNNLRFNINPQYIRNLFIYIDNFDQVIDNLVDCGKIHEFE